jgi:hypothetical protein
MDETKAKKLKWEVPKLTAFGKKAILGDNACNGSFNNGCLSFGTGLTVKRECGLFGSQLVLD